MFCRGLKLLIPGFFEVRKFCKYFFGWLDSTTICREFFIQNNMKIGGCIVLPIKYNQTWAWKFDMEMGFFWVLLEALEIFFLGFNLCPHSIIPIS